MPSDHSGAQICTKCDEQLRDSMRQAATDPKETWNIDTLSVPLQRNLLEELKTAALSDTEYQKWKLVDSPSIFRWIGELLWRDEGGGMQLVVPDNSAVKDVILQECHSAASAGHMAQAKTFERVPGDFGGHTSEQTS